MSRIDAKGIIAAVTNQQTRIKIEAQKNVGRQTMSRDMPSLETDLSVAIARNAPNPINTSGDKVYIDPAKNQLLDSGDIGQCDPMIARCQLGSSNPMVYILSAHINTEHLTPLPVSAQGCFGDSPRYNGRGYAAFLRKLRSIRLTAKEKKRIKSALLNSL